MDLHDYEDVAENYDFYLPEITPSAGFAEFYLSLAGEFGSGGILDIACGTGSLTLPFVQAGYDVTAFDISEAMVKVAKRKLNALNLFPEIFTADMTDFECGRKFSLAVIARSGFMHLTTTQRQRQTLQNIREHLSDGGILTLNTFAPDPRLQALQMNNVPENFTLRAEYTNSRGERERIYNAICYDPLTQIMSGSWKFEVLGVSGEIKETRVRPLCMRQTYRIEMEYLAELCGFEIPAVYGGFKKEAADGTLIWILKKKP